MVSEEQEWLSTGQAARHCSVKPDTILKWIKRGRLSARRTAGGHYRIRRQDLEPMMVTPRGAARAHPPDRFPLRCWEYLGTGGNAADQCQECIVYRSRASWCFEMVEQTREAGHSQRFCAESCHDCTYYQRVRGQATNVLVVTPDQELARLLRAEGRDDLRLRFAASGYEAAGLIADFRPAFVVIDHALVAGPEPGLLDFLVSDPRLAGVRVILAAGRGKATRARAAAERDEVVDVIEKHLGADRIASVVDAFPVEVIALGEQGVY